MTLTPARKHALAVLAATNGQRPPRISNMTSEFGPWPTVYWQVAGWLIDHQLAERTEDFQYLGLTDAGREVVARGVA